MSDNLNLETILLLLAEFGRPKMNQFAVSATPGYDAAGEWNCEVDIPFKHWSDLPEPVVEQWKARQRSLETRRMIGRGETPTIAARACLAQCQELVEGPDAPYLKLISTEMLRRIQANKRNDAI